MPAEPELARLSAPSPSEILSVSALNRSVRDLLEHRYPLLWVAGEISNLLQAKSGHWYFSLKDHSAQVRCVMFRNRSSNLDWQPRDGMQVEARALVTMYEARGDFQLNIETMRRAGQGALYEAFLRLRDKLAAEGLFATERKRELPAYPKAIGVVTSLAAAALRDILTTLRRRNPSIPVIIYPSAVQGEGAAAELTRALRSAGERGECDVVILARGGGSMEDLWAFNDEQLARTICASPVPVVTGVGHETDFTIADFAADHRAPTPTAAAELVSPSRADLLRDIAALAATLSRQLTRNLEDRMQRLDLLTRRLTHPGQRIASQQDKLAQLVTRLGRASAHDMDMRNWRLSDLVQRAAARLPDPGRLLESLAALRGRLGAASSRRHESLAARLERLQGSLTHLGPAAVLARGYSIVQNAQGELVRDGTRLISGDILNLQFAKGSAAASVTRVSRANPEKPSG
jgi:exodeoxyribonuclease VII large subunit